MWHADLSRSPLQSHFVKSSCEQSRDILLENQSTEPVHSKGDYLNVLESSWFRDIAEVQDALTLETFDFFSRRGLKTLHLPVTTCSISSPMGLGSDSLPVKIDLFGVPTYLADSMQFMLEYGCRIHKSGTYYLMPSFRGEDSDETHLCQFYHSEAEIPGRLEDVMTLVEDYLRALTLGLTKRCSAIIRRHRSDLSEVMQLISSSGPLPRVTMDEAVSILGNRPEYIRHAPQGYRSVTREGERRLMKQAGGFVWITDPDHISVPFYQAFSKDGKKAKAADLLFGLGETVGCGERHKSAEDMRKALDMHHVDHEPYDWYAKMREHFPMQTSGFGLGTERYICWLLNHADIRDCQLVPRRNGVVTIP